MRNEIIALLLLVIAAIVSLTHIQSQIDRQIDPSENNSTLFVDEEPPTPILPSRAIAASNESGSSDSYLLLGGRITKPIQLYVKDATIAAEVQAAAATWNAAAGKTLFKLPVAVNPKMRVDKHDSYSVSSYGSASPSFIAYARTWYSSNFAAIIETDIVFSTGKVWTTNISISQADNGRTKDIQTLALHELGHALGLNDLYTLPASDPRRNDLTEIMATYHGPQRTLGAGDRAGLKRLYG